MANIKGDFFLFSASEKMKWLDLQSVCEKCHLNFWWRYITFVTVFHFRAHYLIDVGLNFPFVSCVFYYTLFFPAVLFESTLSLTYGPNHPSPINRRLCWAFDQLCVTVQLKLLGLALIKRPLQ